MDDEVRRLRQVLEIPAEHEWEGAIRLLLRLIGEDLNREGLRRTPLRVKRSLQFLTSGYRQDPAKILSRSFTKVKHDEMIVVKDIDFFSLCLHGKTLVYSPQGALFAASVRPGQCLLTIDPHTRMLAETEVLAVSVSKHRERFRVKFSNGPQLVVSGAHPIYVVGQGYVPAAAVKPGDPVLGAHGRRLKRPVYPCQPSYSLGYVLGAFASDGSTDGNRRVRLEVNEFGFAKRFADHAHRAFGVETHVETIVKPSGFLKRDIRQYRVRICSSFITDVLRELLGGDTHSRAFIFPELVLHNQETMQGFLDGYIEGDRHPMRSQGYYCGDSITSTNVGFMNRLANVLDTPVEAYPNGTIRLYVSKRWFQARNTAKGFKRGFQARPQDVLLRQVIADVTTRVYRVESVTRERASLKSYTMYDFECSPHHSFLANEVLVKNCEHHLIPFFGKCHIAYVPDKRIIGLSKIPRLVDCFAHRLQVQERLTTQIAEAINEHVKPLGVACVIEASHLCMMMRGVQKQNARAVTSSMLGAFRSSEKTRAEFLTLIRSDLAS
jgi:GTP cyclohydrolase I